MRNTLKMKVLVLQAYCQLDYVKIMKYKTEEMLSDNFTKVMAMPGHHVQKCGLKDLQVAMAAKVVASLFCGCGGRTAGGQAPRLGVVCS